MKLIGYIFLGIFILLLTFSAYAEKEITSNSQYTVVVSVKSQSSVEVPQALTNALKQVLVKVSGNPAIISNPSVQHLLTNPSSVIREFEYQAVPKTASASGLVLQVTFDPKLIDRVIQHAQKKEPLPSGQQPQQEVAIPQILSLVVVNAQQPGDVNPNPMIGSNDNSLAEQFLTGIAQQQGIPILLPLLDLQDLKTMSAQTIVQLDLPKITIFAKRYHVEKILVISITSINPVKWQSSWVLLSNSGDTLGQWRVQGQSLEEVITQGFIQSGLQYKLNQGKSISGAKQEIQMTLQNIKSFDDYSHSLAYIRNIPGITNVNVMKVEGSDLYLTFVIEGGAQAFEGVISNQQKMMLIGHPTTNQYILKWLS